MPMLSHVSLGVSDLARATAFYDAVMAALGFQRVWTAEKGVGYGPSAAEEGLTLFRQTGPVRAPGPGFHLALNAPDHGAVDRFHAAGLAHGGTDNGPPGLRLHYGPSYYAAFIIDADGHHLEAVHQTR